MVPKFGVCLLPELDEKILADAFLAEELGYDYLWIGDHCQYDVFSMLTFFAQKTRRVRLGTSVTSPYTRHPTTIAAAIATVNEISSGRAVLGLGAAAGEVLRRQLFVPEFPLLHCKEAIEVIRPLLAGKTVTYEGETVRVNQYRLQMKAANVPIYLAARGPRMLELAGESADGVFINGLGAWPPALKNALQHVATGARQAGRSLRELDVVCWTRIAISEDPDALRDLIRPVIGLKLSVVPDNILKKRFGIGPELAHLIKGRFEAIKRDRDPLRPVGVLGGSVEDLISDSFVEKYCLCGTPEQIVRRIRKLLDAGATQICLLNWPRRDRPEDLSDVRIKTLRTFAEYVIPAFRDC